MELGSASSKVIVELHDPSGVFNLVSRDIAARLPLRNLNWSTPSRPLRQIRQLHVEFVPDKLTENNLRPPVHRFDSNGPNSFDIVRSGGDPRKDAVKERRHQIPGLKTSPYLKIYVLRCDDKDIYKENERKKIREWIRENAQTEAKRGENHDAFEWMILHVVIPGTVAASEPRWRESSKEPDELKERKTSNVKFPGKSTRTVFDRLRADFNESGKGSQDRVAQIRLRENDVPPDLLPTPAVAQTLEETAQERENAWKDLMDKFKVMILGPFDARVRQYEADIAEQESRRSLPGWNFCTFFIHKEGLAKALESIGLVEDALAIYDELSLGLETVLRDMASGRAEGTATTFAQHTDDVEARVLGKPKSMANGTKELSDDSAGLFNKDYREAIVRSSISVFDFFSYLFLRQKTLILRLANAKASRAELGNTGRDGGEDLVLTSEVCWRALSFIHNTARTLRQDLVNGSEPKSQSDVESLVCSWTYVMAEQILAETTAPVLDQAQSQNQALSNGTATPKKLERVDFSFGMGANPYPQRSSSLAIRKSAPELQRPPSPPILATNGTFSPSASSGTDSIPKAAGIPGLPELATYRAELVMIQRKMLEQLAERRGWRAGWAFLRGQRKSQLTDVGLDESKEDEPQNAQNDKALPQIPASDLLAPSLLSILADVPSFHATFELLCEQAIHYYALATQTKSVEVILGDLALLKWQQGDAAAAVQYIKHLLPSFSEDGWSNVETEILHVYTRCLKQLARHDEFVRVGLDVLAKNCSRRMQVRHSQQCLSHRLFYSDDEDLSTPGLLSDLTESSSYLQEKVVRPMDHYFMEITLEREVVHFEDKDGFSLRFSCHSLLDDDIELEEINARLVSQADANQEIWLVSGGPVKLKSGANRIDLETTASALGAFQTDRIVFEARKLRFVKAMELETQPTLRLNDEELTSPSPKLVTTPWVYIYPAQHAFNLQASLSADIQIDKPRYLKFELSSGRNDVESMNIKVKPTSAGLRLRLADAECDGIEHGDPKDAKPGQLCLAGLEAFKSAGVRIPYVLEQATPDISIRLEARYHTSVGDFVYLASAVLRHELPLDVDVNDVFHLNTLFSKFTVRSTNGMPLSVTESTLQESKCYAVQAPPMVFLPLTVSDKYPGSLLYKITRKQQTETKITARDAALALRLEYLSLDELIIAKVTQCFSTDLEQSQFQALNRLLLPLIPQRCRGIYSSPDVEIGNVLGQVKVPSYENFGWQEVVSSLPRAVQSDIAIWLREWHAKHRHVEFDMEGEPAARAMRSITIGVDVPAVDVVYSVSLALDHRNEQTSGSPIVTLGELLSAKLTIRHTRAWSEHSVLGLIEKKSPAEDEFVLEVSSDDDNAWLIGGPRRVHFRANEENEQTFGLTLLPMKLGLLPLPLVEIQPKARAGPDGEEASCLQTSITCETHYYNAGQKIEVIRDVRTTKAHIPETFANLPPSRPTTGSRSVAEPG